MTASRPAETPTEEPQGLELFLLKLRYTEGRLRTGRAERAPTCSGPGSARSYSACPPTPPPPTCACWPAGHPAPG